MKAIELIPWASSPSPSRGGLSRCCRSDACVASCRSPKVMTEAKSVFDHKRMMYGGFKVLLDA